MKKLRRIRLRMAIALAALWMGMGVLPSANAQRPFVVQGELTGLPDGTVLLLLERRNNMDSRVDCDTLQNGRFRLEAMASEVKMFTVRLSDERLLTNMLQVWGQSGDTVSVNGEGRRGFEWQVQSANPLQAEYAAYVHAASEEYRQMDECLKQCEELEKRIQQEPEGQRQVLKDSLENASNRFTALSCKATGKQFAMLKQRYQKDGTVEPLSPCAEYILFYAASDAVYGDGSLDIDEMRAFYESVPENRRQSYMMQYAGVLLFPPTVAKQGDLMYDGAVLYDLLGNKHRLSDYNKGKYLLLDFWSCACGPCLMSFPELKTVSEELKDSLVVISISSDMDKEWKETSAAHDITWVNLNDRRGSTGIFAHYGFEAFPFYVIISPEGKIVKTFTGYSEGRIKQKLSSIFPQYK